MIFKVLACGLFRGHDYVGMSCKRCGCEWGWKPERTADEVQADIDRELDRLTRWL